MRYDRSEYGIHRHLVVTPTHAPVARLRTPPPVYAYGARVRYWAALGLTLLAFAGGGCYPV